MIFTFRETTEASLGDDYRGRVKRVFDVYQPSHAGLTRIILILALRAAKAVQNVPYVLSNLLWFSSGTQRELFYIMLKIEIREFD